MHSIHDYNNNIRQILNEPESSISLWNVLYVSFRIEMNVEINQKP